MKKTEKLTLNELKNTKGGRKIPGKVKYEIVTLTRCSGDQ